MAKRPLRTCSSPGCSELTSAAYCDKHKKQHDKQRGSSYERGYNSTWRKHKILLLIECLRRKHHKINFQHQLN